MTLQNVKVTKIPIISKLQNTDKISMTPQMLPVAEMSIFNSFVAQEDPGVPFHRNFNSILRSDHQKKNPMSR